MAVGVEWQGARRRQYLQILLALPGFVQVNFGALDFAQIERVANPRQLGAQGIDTAQRGQRRRRSHRDRSESPAASSRRRRGRR